MNERTQRYKLTAEFVLRDRSDYHYWRKRIQAEIDKMSLQTGILFDYLTIEKKEEDK